MAKDQTEMGFSIPEGSKDWSVLVVAAAAESLKILEEGPTEDNMHLFHKIVDEYGPKAFNNLPENVRDAHYQRYLVLSQRGL